MSKLIDLTGSVFNRWTVIERGENKSGQTLFKCVCRCGNTAWVGSRNLRMGKSKSCGCYQKDQLKKTAKKYRPHWLALRSVMNGMKYRCYREYAKCYKNYGGNGIKICKAWLNSFDDFYTWSLNHGYKSGLTIDRINNKLGYTPRNCRWVTPLEQSKNSSRSIKYKVKNKMMTRREIRELLKLTDSKMRGYVKRGKVNELIRKIENGLI